MHELTFLQGSAPDVARQLLGCILEREVDGQFIRVMITETEAYDQTDIASHSYRGETERTRVMFGPAGHLYVYFTYGMHYCCNVVVGSEGYGAAVLIRAVTPLEGENLMKIHRGGRGGAELSNGPAKVCQALTIDKQLNGHDLRKSPLRLVPASLLDRHAVEQTVRIGITKGKETPWRFFIQAY